MEERWFKMGDAMPVEEGEMTLRVAKMLAVKLRDLGARVSFVRQQNEPATPFHPDDFRVVAREVLEASGIENPRDDFDGPDDPRWFDERNLQTLCNQCHGRKRQREAVAARLVGW